MKTIEIVIACLLAIVIVSALTSKSVDDRCVEKFIELGHSVTCDK